MGGGKVSVCFPLWPFPTVPSLLPECPEPGIFPPGNLVEPTCLEKLASEKRPADTSPMQSASSLSQHPIVTRTNQQVLCVCVHVCKKHRRLAPSPPLYS